MLLAALTYLSAFALYAVDLSKSTKLTGRAQAAPMKESIFVTADVQVAVVPPGGTTEPHPPEERSAGSSPRAKRVLARSAAIVTIYAFVLHLGSLTARGFAAGRLPWDNLYGFVTTSALIMVGIFLAILLRRDLGFVGILVTALALIMIVTASVGINVPIVPLSPALQSRWIVIHTLVAMTATALFALSFCMSVLQLLQLRRRARGGRGPRFLRAVPSVDQLQIIAGRCAAVGFLFWTGTLIFGAIWANEAWGRYWGWDVKEVWAFIIWVCYAGYLHARVTQDWQGPRLAWLNVTAFGSVAFNSSIVNIFFNGLHSYSGLVD